MGICNSCNYGKNHICPEQNVYRTVCSFKDPNRKTKKKDTETIVKKDEVKNENMMVKDIPMISKKDLRICEEYKAGATVEELATRYGLHRTTIPRILKRNDVPMRDPRAGIKHVSAGSISEEAIEAVFKEFDKGTFAKDISKRFGLTLYRIGQLKKEWYKNKDAVEVRNETMISIKPEEHELSQHDNTNLVYEDVSVAEIKAEPKHYIYYSGKTKPAEMFAPAELNDELIWAAKIKSLDDIFTVAAEAGVSTYEVKDGNLFASSQIVLNSGGIVINPTTVAKAVEESISQARTHAIV